MARDKKRARAGSGNRILDLITGDDPHLRAAIESHKCNSRVAEMILAARERAGLTQVQLAKLVGTTQSVISRLESADYDGHSLTMLQRIAAALRQDLDVRFVPLRR